MTTQPYTLHEIDQRQGELFEGNRHLLWHGTKRNQRRKPAYLRANVAAVQAFMPGKAMPECCEAGKCAGCTGCPLKARKEKNDRSSKL